MIVKGKTEGPCALCTTDKERECLLIDSEGFKGWVCLRHLMKLAQAKFEKKEEPNLFQQSA